MGCFDWGRGQGREEVQEEGDAYSVRMHKLYCKHVFLYESASNVLYVCRLNTYTNRRREREDGDEWFSEHTIDYSTC